MHIDLFSEDLEKYNNTDKYAALQEFCKLRLSEGWRLDYAVLWDDRALEKVASFANTFGGLLIIGVKKDKTDAEPVPVGVTSKVELKTQIASAIAANVSPVPVYFVYEIHKPEDSNSRFCIIQIKDRGKLHLINKKYLRPIHIRNEDETREAGASDVQRLVERNRAARGDQEHQANANRILPLLRIKSDRKELEHGRESSSDSQSFFKLILVPIESFDLELDRRQEDALKRLVRSIYPIVGEKEANTACWLKEDRDSTFFEWNWYLTNYDWDMRWRITSKGEIAHATQILSTAPQRLPAWSAVDLADFSFLFISLCAKWWSGWNYFGDGLLLFDLATDNFPVSQVSAGAFDSRLNPEGGSRDLKFISPDCLRLATVAKSRATGTLKINPVLMNESGIRTLTSILNAILRDLGHQVDWPALSSGLQSLYKFTSK